MNKIPIGTRVRWLGSAKFPGTIIKYQRFMAEEGYLIQWDNGKLGQHSESDFIVVEEPNNVMKQIV